MTYVSTVDILIRRPESLCVVENCASNSRPLITSRMTYPKPHILSPYHCCRCLNLVIITVLSVLVCNVSLVCSRSTAPGQAGPHNRKPTKGEYEQENRINYEKIINTILAMARYIVSYRISRY